MFLNLFSFCLKGYSETLRDNFKLIFSRTLLTIKMYWNLDFNLFSLTSYLKNVLQKWLLLCNPFSLFRISKSYGLIWKISS